MGKEKVVEKVVIAHEKAKDTAQKDHHDFHDDPGPLHVSRNLPVKAARKAARAIANEKLIQLACRKQGAWDLLRVFPNIRALLRT